ncbi:MAG: hypothetical protein V7760_08030 [Marinobacter sp.]
MYWNVDIPVTGLSCRENLFEQDKVGTRKRPGEAQPSSELPPLAEKIATVRLDTKTGDIAILDPAGNDLGPNAMDMARTYASEELEHTLQQQVDSHNRMMERIGAIHLGTPAPDAFPSMVAGPFEEPEPAQPELLKRDWLAVICPARQRAFEASNERREVVLAEIYEKVWRGETSAMESLLDDHLLDIDWPRETELSFELSDDGKTLMLDLGLPEIEDFPTTELRTCQRGIGVSVKAFV